MVVCWIARHVAQSQEERPSQAQLDSVYRHLVDGIRHVISSSDTHVEHNGSHSLRLHAHGGWIDSYD